MTIQDALQNYMTQLNQQILEYQANVTNIMAILDQLQEQQKAVAQWLAANPA